MASPKIFVSSTCYDLQEIRYNLKNFIKDFGYDPIMSEFGDIFYPPDIHVQDACIYAIPDCDMFILIIGNKYGSEYHQEKYRKDKHLTPSSITLEEFQKSISCNIPKIIFINRFVRHDYVNYRRYFRNKADELFKSREFKDQESANQARDILKIEIDDNYPFAIESYRYVFHFLDKIYDLDSGNSIHDFENSSDIQIVLKQQWAGYLADSLKSFRNKSQIRESEVFEQKTFYKLEQLEKILTSLAKDLNIKEEPAQMNNFIAGAKMQEFQDSKEQLNNSLDHIFIGEEWDNTNCNINQGVI